MEKQLGVTKVRQRLAYVIDDVRYRGEHYIILQHGKPAAVVVPLEVYHQWKQERDEFFAAIRRIQESNPQADPERVEQEVLEAQQDVRRSHAKR